MRRADIPEVARSIPTPTRASTAHHARTGENRQSGEQPCEEARLCRFSTSLCASREMLVKRKLLFLLIAYMTRNGVPSPAGFRHCTEICMVASHVSHRCASHSPHTSSNIRAIYHLLLTIERMCPVWNLQLLRIAGRIRGGFSVRQWRCCSSGWASAQVGGQNPPMS